VASSIALPTSVQPLMPSALTGGYSAAASSPAGTMRLGPGLSSSGDGRPDARGHIKGSGGGGTSAHPGGGGVPGTAFLGVRDQATRVVYVIDCSASMANDNRMRSAKAALVASLQSLTEMQQFQILFYNNTPNLMRLRSGASLDMAFATEVNKTLARQHISGIEPSDGTDHVPALKMALRLGPEVIFFLTDADEPQLSAGELHELHRLNAGRTRIHTIEFGRGAELGDTVNFLKKLAAQNGGTYRYHDVRRIAMDRP
jgi:Ca-activated chloride channel family protein